MNEWGLVLSSIFVGIMTSFHCVGMCGPLSCALIKSENFLENGFSLFQYHLGRVISYGLIGGAAGGLGSVFFEGIPMKPLRVLSWFFVGVYVVVAWGWEIKTTPGSMGFKISSFFYPWLMRFKNRSAFSLGLVTPLIPCTPLYFSTSAAFLSGNSLWGALIMVAFVMGTLPLYTTFQVFWMRIQKMWNPSQLKWARRMLALLAVGIMAWRVYSGEFMKASSGHLGNGFPCFDSPFNQSGK